MKKRSKKKKKKKKKFFSLSPPSSISIPALFSTAIAKAQSPHSPSPPSHPPSSSRCRHHSSFTAKKARCDMAVHNDTSPRRRRSYGASSAPPSPNTGPEAAGPESMVPFSWEEKPGTPKQWQGSHISPPSSSSSQSIFRFTAFFSDHHRHALPLSLTPADQLFLNGRIRPLRPPPYLRSLDSAQPVRSSPPSPLKKAFCRLSHPSQQASDPFAAAMEKSAKGKDRKGHRRTGSLSPLRIFHWDAQPAETGSQREELVWKEQLGYERRKVGWRGAGRLRKWLLRVWSGRKN